MYQVRYMELKYDRNKNFQQRIEFIHMYADWVKSVPNKIWSKQQADFINSLILNSKNFSLSAEQYLTLLSKARKTRPSERNHQIS